VPTYDYICTACGYEIEVIHSVHGEGPACPKCGARMRKAIGTCGPLQGHRLGTQGPILRPAEQAEAQGFRLERFRRLERGVGRGIRRLQRIQSFCRIWRRDDT